MRQKTGQSKMQGNESGGSEEKKVEMGEPAIAAIEDGSDSDSMMDVQRVGDSEAQSNANSSMMSNTDVVRIGGGASSENSMAVSMASMGGTSMAGLDESSRRQSTKKVIEDSFNSEEGEGDGDVALPEEPADPGKMAPIIEEEEED